MRPRKIILCVSGDEEVLSVRMFMLTTNYYAVIGCDTAQEAIAAVTEEYPIDLILTDQILPGVLGTELVELLKVSIPHIPMIVLADLKSVAAICHRADAVLSSETPTVELLERIKVMSARKRGPRKKIVVSCQPSVEDAAVQRSGA